MKKVLEVSNISKEYGKKGNITKALDGVSFGVTKGEFIGIMGASGSGKTTLLNCVSTIDYATSGNIEIEGKSTISLRGNALSDFRSHNLGFIFQDFNLLDTLTAYENIALALTIIKTPSSEIDGKIKRVCELLNIMDVVNKYPYQMSGGQKQRVASARAIVTDPSLILADEPTGALDSKSAKVLLESLERLNKDLNSTILMVTHDAFTASYCNRILFLRDGKMFHEIHKESKTRKQFFDEIMKVIALLGGDEDVN